jgi:hypothetical protein
LQRLTDSGNRQEKIMAFINELISDEDKKKIDWTKFKAWPFTPSITPWKWTIDRERDVFFIPLGGRGPDGERPDVYGLWWKGILLRIEARLIGTGSGKFWDSLYWDITKIDIPDDLCSQRKEILDTLREALCAHGSLFSTEHVKSVTVEFAVGSAS